MTTPNLTTTLQEQLQTFNIEELLDFLLQPVEPLPQDAPQVNFTAENAATLNTGMSSLTVAFPETTSPVLSTPNHSRLKAKSKRNNWQEWRDQVAEQLMKRSEDPSFVIKKYIKESLKPKPYDRYTQRFQHK